VIDMRKTIAVIALLLPIAAQADQEYSVPWLMARPQLLEQTLRLCHTDARYANTPTCSNAESAAAGRMAQDWQRQARSGSVSMYDPDYWTHNKVARAGVLLQCRRRGPNDWPVYPFCDAAVQSAMRDMH